MNDIDASDVQVISAEPERIRVSVFGGRTQLDIRLPVDLPVSSFIPDLAKLVRSRDVPLDEDPRVKEERRTFWVLSRFDNGIVIRPEQTLREAGVVNGELLRLKSNRALSPPTLYDDVVDAAARLNKAAYAEWDSRSARWMAFVGVNLGAFALAFLLIQPMPTIEWVITAGLGLMALVGLTTFAAVAHRSFGLDDVAMALGAATIPVSAVVVGVPLGHLGNFGLAGACAALVLVNYVVYRLIGTGHWPFLATSLIAGLCGGAILVHAVGVRTDIVCLVLAIVTVLLCGAVPRLTAGREHFETPVAPSTEPADEWSLDNPFPATESPKPLDDTNSGTNMPTAEEVWARVRSATLTRSALLFGFAGTAVAACVVLLHDADRVDWAVAAFTLNCAAVLGLRSRYFRSWGERVAPAVPAIALVITIATIAQSGRFPIPVAAVSLLLAIAVGAVVLGLAARPGRFPSTRRTNALAYLDYLAVGALVPLALWVLDVYRHLGPWW